MIAYAFGSDWIWVLLVVVVLFGGSQLPKLAKNAGDAMKEFRKAHDEASSTGPVAGQTFAAPVPVSQSSMAQSSIAQSPGAQPMAQQAVAPAPVPIAPGTPQPAIIVPATPHSVVQPAPVASATAAPAPGEASPDQVTLSRAELDALLTVARERAAQGQPPQG